MPIKCLVAINKPSEQLKGWPWPKQLGFPMAKPSYCASPQEVASVLQNDDMHVIVGQVCEGIGFTVDFWSDTLKGPDAKNICFILASEKIEKEWELLEELGASDFLEIPFQTPTWVFRVKKAFEKSISLTNPVRKLKENSDLKELGIRAFSEELAEPITSLKSFVDLLYRDSDTFSREEIKFVTDNVCHSLESIQETLSQLLGWATIEKRKSPFYHIVLDKNEVSQMLQQSQVKIQYEITQKNLKFKYTLPEVLHMEWRRDVLKAAIEALFWGVCRFSKKYAEIHVKMANDVLLNIEVKGFAIRKEQQEQLLDFDYYNTSNITPFEKSVGVTFIIVGKLCHSINLDFYLSVTEELTVFTIARKK